MLLIKVEKFGLLMKLVVFIKETKEFGLNVLKLVLQMTLLSVQMGQFGLPVHKK